MAKQFPNVPHKYSAPMGRPSFGTPEQAAGKIRLFRIRLVDGDYDDGGAYWGAPEDLYCARDAHGTYQQVVRAVSREAARITLGIPASKLRKVPPVSVDTLLRRHLSQFVEAYLTCALWASTTTNEDGSCSPLDDGYSEEDVAESARTEATDECSQFIADNATDLQKATEYSNYTWASAGHDFWLTRCGHGAGYWDRGLGEAGDRLSEAARRSGGRDAYVGEDSRIYIS